jgi:hypothetical protein
MSDGTYRNSLSRHAHLMRDPDPQGARRLAQAQWHKDGTIAILPGDKAQLDRLDRELLDAICAKLYGKRGI